MTTGTLVAGAAPGGSEIWPDWFGISGLIVASLKLALLMSCGAFIALDGLYVTTPAGTTVRAPTIMLALQFCDAIVRAALLIVVIRGCMKITRRDPRGVRMCAMASATELLLIAVWHGLQSYLHYTLVGIPAPSSPPVLGGQTAVWIASALTAAVWLLEFGWPVVFLVWWLRPSIRQSVRAWHAEPDSATGSTKCELGVVNKV